MPRKKLAAQQTFSPAFDQKIIKLAVLFFALSTILFVTGIFKLNRISNTMPFSQARDYLVFEKNSDTESLKVYRSGKVIGLGSKMFVDILSPQQLDRLLATIDKTDILNKDCPENPEGKNSQSYTIKLGVQIKRTNSDACKAELDQIESQIFQ